MSDDWQEFEDAWLAPYAVRSRESRGRKHSEPLHPFRTAFQRDRERIVHSSAFRRMTGKTQVLVATVNDHHRTRLTHTLEVAQIARTAARRLRLNEDLTEAIALAHDIGHPPFGHAGEEALNDCLKPFGGFNHNLYGLRRVDHLEERYPEFPGLNLTFELREAFVRHSGILTVAEAEEFLNVAGTLSVPSDGNGTRSVPVTMPPLEAQIVDVVDSIAYDTHDLDDALGLDLIDMNELELIPFWKLAEDRVNARVLPTHARRTAVVRELIAWQVTDLLEHTKKRIGERGIQTALDVRNCPEFLVGFSREVQELKAGLERFLRRSVYRHERVLKMTSTGKMILRALFAEYVSNPKLLPERHYGRWAGSDVPGNLLPGRVREAQLERVVCDYLAGMTDRFAQQEYQRLFKDEVGRMKDETNE